MPDAITAQLILAEIVMLIEKLHKTNILHGDLHPGNFVIDSNGHLLMTDFGRAETLSSDDITSVDWNRIYYMCFQLFAKPKRDKTEIDLIRMLRTMTTAQLPGIWLAIIDQLVNFLSIFHCPVRLFSTRFICLELKSLSYFNGIDWAKVDLRAFQAPFEPSQSQINQRDAMDLVSLLNVRADDELNGTTAERLSCKLKEKSNDWSDFHVFSLNYRFYICRCRTCNMTRVKGWKSFKICNHSRGGVNQNEIYVHAMWFVRNT